MTARSSNAEDGTTGITPAGHGVLKPLTQNRDMKCYIVTDFEINGLSRMSGNCTFNVGMATALMGIAVGFWTSGAFADPKTITPVGVILAGPAAWIVFMLAIAFVVAAVISFFSSKGAIGRIKDESQQR